MNERFKSYVKLILILKQEDMTKSQLGTSFQWSSNFLEKCTWSVYNETKNVILAKLGKEVIWLKNILPNNLLLRQKNVMTIILSMLLTENKYNNIGDLLFQKLVLDKAFAFKYESSDNNDDADLLTKPFSGLN